MSRIPPQIKPKTPPTPPAGLQPPAGTMKPAAGKAPVVGGAKVPPAPPVTAASAGTTAAAAVTSKSADPNVPVVARASTEYRIKRYLIVAMLIGMGGWFGYDGLVGWPRENARIDQIGKERIAAREVKDETLIVRLNDEERKLQRHSESDLRLQRILCYTLPPVGLLVLGWAFYRSRGTVKLSNGILSAPGHPPVPLDAIRSIDKTYWEKKGIAYVNYELANGRTGSVTLDDFIYERQPIDDIFKRIEDFTGTGEAPAAAV